MFKKMRTPFWEATATLVGTIIGAGVLGMPYAFSKTGFWVGALTLILLAACFMLLKLFFAEVVLRTEGKHQMAGYAEKYLGKKTKWFMSVLLILGIYGALLAYVVGEGRALAAIFGGSSYWYSIGFYGVFSLLVIRGLSLIKRAELFLTSSIFIVVAAIGVVSFSHFSWANITLVSFSAKDLLLVYGVTLFALSGMIAIPEARQVLLRKEYLLPRVVVVGVAIPTILYFFFALIVLGISGAGVTEVATVGLGKTVGIGMIVIGNLFAVFAMSTSFLTLSLGLRQVYQYDYGIRKPVALALTLIPVILIFLAGLDSFVKIMGVIGAVGVGIDSLLVVLMYWRAKKLGDRMPEFSMPRMVPVGVFFILLFIVGVIYTFL